MTRRTGMRAISLLSAIALMGVSVLAPGNGQTAEAAKKAKLKTKKISVKKKKKKTIVIKNKVKKAKYTFKSKKKKIASVTKKGVVKGVKAGKATIVVTEKKGKKKRTVGNVKVTVTKKKVPVVTFNSDIVGTKRCCFVGMDNQKSGQTAAGLMNMLTGGVGKILIITGFFSNSVNNARVDGFIEEIKKEIRQQRISVV